uniref:Uncharacterized protein n=1 Tax=Timema tahoe TaxID=61484 RepID=A0A7R9ITD3_9NEOP|nr:unnamed protein product [Timema tahoe]
MMNHVFGQHLVIDIVVKALRGHFYRGHPSKALAMSFHGWPGGGKNYVSQFITNSLYAKGSRSRFVHFFAGKLHFPLQEQADIYRKLKGRFSSVFACPDQTEPICRLFQLHLQDWIRGNVSQCYWSTFIFDEVDKMPRGVLDAVKPFIDHHDHIDGVEYRHAIFIFLSNTGGNTITKRHLELWQSGKRREDFELRDFEDLIRKGAFNEAGGWDNGRWAKHNGRWSIHNHSKMCDTNQGTAMNSGGGFLTNSPVVVYSKMCDTNQGTAMNSGGATYQQSGHEILSREEANC